MFSAGHTNHYLFQEGTGHGGVQDYRQGEGNDHERGTSKGNHELETGLLWCSYVQVTPAALQKCNGGWGCYEGGCTLCNSWPYCSKGILSGWCPLACPYHAEGHHSPVWDHQHTWQHRCLRVLHAGPHAHWVSMGPQAAHFCSPNCFIWGVIPRLLQVPICLRNLSSNPIIIPAKVVVGKVAPANWVLLVALPMEASGEPACDPQKDWIGGAEPPGLRGAAQGGTRPGQEAAGQMGTSVCPQWPGPRKDIPNQTPD